MPKPKLKIAALACSYNRMAKTTSFLKSVSGQSISDSYTIKMYLLDDNSPDGTADYVETNFPEVTVIRGTGSLFWAGGMRTLWEEVIKKDDYDFFLLLNDDVILFDDALPRLLSAYSLAEKEGNILLGTVKDPDKDKVTYGGLKMKNSFTGFGVKQEPDATKLKPCELGNANIMLVDKFTVSKIGILSASYTHGLADFDYTLAATKNGLHVWIAPGYYGYCKNDHGVSWLSQKTPLKKRIDYLYSPKGLAYKEYMVYIRKNFPLMAPNAIIKLWLKTLFPFIYTLMKSGK